MENRLEHRLRFDRWNLIQAILILCDLDPDGTETSGKGDITEARTLGGQKLLGVFDDDELKRLQELSRAVDDLRQIWWSGDHDDEAQAPQCWIDWARSKRISIPWRDWAQRRGLVSNTPKLKEQEYFTPWLSILHSTIAEFLAPAAIRMRRNKRSLNGTVRGHEK